MTQHNALLQAPQLVLVGAFGRNDGKTTLACELIQHWKKQYPVYALKIISIDHANGKCHRGKAGCGICTSLTANYELTEENGTLPEKDTALMLAAGAQKAFLLKTLKTHLQEAFACFLNTVPAGTLVVCESNSLRRVVQPGAFLFAGSKLPPVEAMKASAVQVYAYADALVPPKTGAHAAALRISEGANGVLQVKPANGILGG